MALEAGTFIDSLVATNPTATDSKSQGDDHLRLLKSTLKATFPNINGAVTVTDEAINNLAQKDGSNLTTPALGDSSTKIATTAFVAGTSMTTNLPGQTGNSGKVITTDGTNPSWQAKGLVIMSTAGGTLSKSDANGIMANASYTMPDLTTTTDSFSIMAMSNAYSVPTSFAFADGWSVASGFVAGTLAAIAPISKGSAHGAWGAAAMTPPTLATITGTGAPTIRATVMMPSSILVVFYDNGTDFKAVAIDLVGNTAGTPINVRAGTIPSFVTAFKDGTTNLAVGYKITGNNIYISGLALSGTTLTASTATQVVASPPLAPMVKLTDGLYSIIDNNFVVYAMSVSGITTPVISTGTAAAFTGTGAYVSGLQPLTSTTALLTGGNGTTGTVSAAARTITYSGTSTPTLNTLATAATAVMRNTSANSGLIGFDATHFLQYGNDVTTATTTNFYCVTVSGTTASFGAVNAQTTNTPTTYLPITYDYYPGQQVIKYNATQILFGNLAGPYIVSYSGTTITVGSAQLSGQTAGTFLRDYAAAMWAYVGSAAFDIFTITGSTITSSEQVAAVPTVFFTSTLNNKVVKYTNWYTWTVTLTLPVSATKSLSVVGNDFKLYGTIN